MRFVRSRRPSWANRVHDALRITRLAGWPLGPALEKRLLTFGDDAKVELFAGDVRAVMADIRAEERRRAAMLAKPAERPPLTIRRSVALLILATAHRVFRR